MGLLGTGLFKRGKDKHVETVEDVEEVTSWESRESSRFEDISPGTTQNWDQEPSLLYTLV